MTKLDDIMSSFAENLKMLNVEPIKISKIFYFDESNNIKKGIIGKDKDNNEDLENLYFVLGGIAIDKNVSVAGKSIVKANPHEKVGVFCKKNGKPYVIEYSEITDEMAEAVDKDGELLYGESHILCNLFRIDAIERMGSNPLPYHIAYKKAKYIDKDGNLVEPESPNAYKFEAFLFDAFGEVDDIAVLRVKREEEFAPVKNADSAGVDCPKTARKLYEDFYHLK